MGKKAKKRVKSVQKVKHGPSTSPRNVSVTVTNNPEASEDGVEVIKNREVCPHINEGINFDTLSAKFGSSGSCKCEDCHTDTVERQGRRGKGKHGKKGATSSKSESIWVCLECGHFSCGGVGFPTTPQSHAVRHAKKSRHSLVVHYKNHQLFWCFQCNKLISAQKFEDNKLKEVLCEVVKMLREKQDQGSHVDVEDVWFGSGSVTSAIKSDCSTSIAANGGAGYSIRGLSNLGNTCFFNSIMQNLLSIKSLRNHFLRLDESAGPLSAALRKLFLETSAESNSRSAINPSSVFGSLCTKAPQFSGYQQHDSHELLRGLLDALSSEELSARKHIDSSSQDSKTGPTFVDAIFGGQLSSTVSCLECRHSSTIFEPFLDLSLPVPTKKSSIKRNQPVARGKRPKLPPKRSARNQSKISSVSMARENVSNQSTSSGNYLSETQPLVEPENQLMLFQGESASSTDIDPNGVAFDMNSPHEDLSVIQVPQNGEAVENVTEHSTSLDCFTWLDYLESDPVPNNIGVTLQRDENPVISGFANDGPLNDIPYANVVDSCTENNLVSAIAATSLDDKFDAIELLISKQFEDKANGSEEVNEKQSSESHNRNEVVEHNADIGCNSDLSNQFCSKDSSTSQRDDEGNWKTQDPEIMTVPIDVSSSGGEQSRGEVQVSSAVGGQEQDDLDFNGFGSLFDEPEVTSDDHTVKTGVNANSSDSDPNEVDDKDAPVSVESCFASFTKPELLTKEEHAWQCDNCSKVLQEQKVALNKKFLTPKMEILPSGCKDPMPNGVVDAVRAFHHKNVEKEVADDNGNCMPEYPETVVICTTFHSDDTSLETAYQCLDSSEYSNLSDQNPKPCTSLLPPEGESDETEQEEVNPENLKAKRDATKRILINKVPPVLTIHLKRFSQDARGRLSKLKGHVNFKEIMDLKPYMDSRGGDGEMFKYRLIGVVEHLGTMRGGHYVAYVRGAKGYGDCWYYASDAHVREVSLEEVLKCQAYILFYEGTA